MGVRVVDAGADGAVGVEKGVDHVQGLGLGAEPALAFRGVDAGAGVMLLPGAVKDAFPIARDISLERAAIRARLHCRLLGGTML